MYFLSAQAASAPLSPNLLACPPTPPEHPHPTGARISLQCSLPLSGPLSSSGVVRIALRRAAHPLPRCRKRHHVAAKLLLHLGFSIMHKNSHHDDKEERR